MMKGEYKQMDMRWEMDNPAVSLEEYYENVDVFAQKKKSNDILEGELSSKESEFSSKSSELDGIKKEFSLMGNYENDKIESLIQDINDNAQKQIDDKLSELESNQKNLTEKKNQDILDNDSWLKKRLEELLGDVEEPEHELKESEQKALDFENERRKFIKTSNEKINFYEDSISEEQLACQTNIGELKDKQDKIIVRFEPDIIKYKKIIDDINEKYQPEIRECQIVVREKVSDRDSEISQLQNERNREIQLSDREIDGYHKEYKQTERQFNEQIRMAKIQKKPTTRMENSKVSRLNAINDKIDKINNKTDKRIAAINQKIDIAQSKYAKQIEKAESQLNAVISRKDEELDEPTQNYNELIESRDNEISVLQSQIDKIQKDSDIKISENKSYIEKEKKAQQENESKIDKQIVEYVMNGDTCFSDVLDEHNAPFASLQNRTDKWMNLLLSIKKGKYASKYQKEHEKQKKILAEKKYSDLQSQVTEAEQFKDKISIFAQNNEMVTIIGGAVAILGAVLFIVLFTVLKLKMGILGIVLTAIGVSLVCTAIIKTNKEFSQICKYISLANDYKEFPEIAVYSTQITQGRELERMKKLGNKLYDIYYGRADAQNIHDSKDLDIKSDYDRNVKIIEKEFENFKAQVIRKRDAEIKSINDENSDKEHEFNKQKDDLQERIKILISYIENLKKQIKDLKNELHLNNQFIEVFEDKYKVFENKIGDSGWLTPRSYSHCILKNDFYIIQENEKDEYGHMKIYRILHNKKALVVNYDISNVNGDNIVEISKIIQKLIYELMVSIYRVNSKETYEQYIVDDMSATDALKESKYTNNLNIKRNVTKLEDIKDVINNCKARKDEFNSKGIKIDELNEQNYRSQEKPCIYNILYIVFKPEERRNKLDDNLRRLLPECEKYGFFPIFICEHETWNKEIAEKESVYKDIKGYANCERIIYDGMSYTIE